MASERKQQPRSLRTQERILAATETLLAGTDLDQLTLEQIAERAHVSIGAFYKQFRGKGSLLPRLLQRVQRQQLQKLHALFAQPQWQQARLAERVDWLVQAFAQAQLERQKLFRALVVGHLGERDAPDAASIELMHTLREQLLARRDEIRHPSPEIAVGLGLYASLHSLQSALLFDRVPPQLGVDGLVRETARLLRRYLGVDSEAD